MLGSSKDPQELISKAEEFLLKALAIDDKNADTLGNLSQVHTRKKEYDKAIASAERAVTLRTGLIMGALSLCHSSQLCQTAGASHCVGSKRRSGSSLFASSVFHFDFGIALRDMERWTRAVAMFKKRLNGRPTGSGRMRTWRSPTACWGMDTEARAEAAEVLRINPEVFDRMGCEEHRI